MSPLALSTCWNSYRHQDGYAMLKEIRQLGFPVCELGHAIRFSLWPGILRAAEEDLIKIQTLHNYCPVPTSVFRPDPNCYEYSDPRASMREAAVRATEDTIRHAAKFGAKAVVLHLGSAGPAGISQKLETIYQHGGYLNRTYVDLKVKAVIQRREAYKKIWPRVKACLEPVVDLAGELNIRLGFEIREDFEEFPNEVEFAEVLEAFPQQVVGYWHDFGHSQAKEFLGWHDHLETLALRKDRLFGLHIHDCRRPQEDHLPLGHGEIDFSSLLPLVPENAIGVLELAPGTPEEQVIASRHLWNSYVAALGLIIRCVVSLLAVGYVIHIYDWPKIWANIQTMDYLWLAVGLVGFIPTLFIVSWRWRMLLGVHDVHLRFWRVFELNMIGQFFSTVGVGATGGDVFKIFYVARAVPDRRTAVAFTVIVDRVIGLIALVLFGASLASFRLPLLMSTPHTKALTITFGLFVVGAVGGSIVASIGPYFLTRPFFKQLGARLPMAHRGAKLYAAYDRSARALGKNVLAVFASIPSHMSITMMAYCIMLAMSKQAGFQVPDLVAFCAIVAIVNLLIAMPVSISGIGLRELLFPMFLALVNVPADKAGTFAITYFAMCTVWNLAGGPFYFMYRHETHTPPPDVNEVEPIFDQ